MGSEGGEEEHDAPVFVKDAYAVLHACGYLQLVEVVENMMSSAVVHILAVVQEIDSALMALSNQFGQLVGSAVVEIV